MEVGLRAVAKDSHGYVGVGESRFILRNAAPVDIAPPPIWRDPIVDLPVVLDVGRTFDTELEDLTFTWEFVSGPLNAGTFGPGTLDNTFGPQLRFVKAPAEGQGQNLPPTLGLQFFGHVAIDGRTETMTVTLKDVDDRALWSTVLQPSYA